MGVESPSSGLTSPPERPGVTWTGSREGRPNVTRKGRTGRREVGIPVNQTRYSRGPSKDGVPETCKRRDPDLTRKRGREGGE